MSFKDTVKTVWRAPLQSVMRRRLKKDNVRIVASMCAGGILYHDLGLRFLSPTINMTIEPFGAFCTDLERYMTTDPDAWQMSVSPFGYPVAAIDRIIIKGVHYHSAEEMKDIWRRRAARFNSDTSEIVLLATDAQIKTEEDTELFHALPYKKVCFTNRHIPYDEFVYVPGFDDEPYVGDILRYADIFGTRVFEKRFDTVSWINQ